MSSAPFGFPTPLNPDDIAALLARNPMGRAQGVPDIPPIDAGGFDAIFNNAPPGQGTGVAPQAVAPIRNGLIAQAPGKPDRPTPVPAPPAPDDDGPDAASKPATGAVPARSPGFGVPSVAASPIGAPQSPAVPPMVPAAAQPAAEPDFLDRLGSGIQRNGDLLGALGVGLLSRRGIGQGLGAGMQLAQEQESKRAATDLARQEFGLKKAKLTQEALGNNATVEALVRGGYSRQDATALVQAAVAGHQEGLQNALNNTFRKVPDAPAGFALNPDGTMRVVAGGPQDPAVQETDAAAKARGTAAGTPEKDYNLGPGQTRMSGETNQPVAAMPDRSKILEHSSSIRKEIHGLPSYKNYTQALPVYQGMLETAGRDSKASDLNLIYGLGKIMDPGSVVREGELRLAQDTQGVADRLIGMYNGVMGGARLSPQARQQLLTEAYGRIQSYEQAFGQDRRGYEGIVGRQGMNPDDVLPSFAPVKPYQPPAKPSGKATAPTRSDLEAEARRRGLLQ